jgi:hypothetical protein
VDTLLALLLLLVRRHHGLAHGATETESMVVQASKRVQRWDVLQGGVLAQQEVALAQVVCSKVLEEVLNGGETRVNLRQLAIDPRHKSKVDDVVPVEYTKHVKRASAIGSQMWGGGVARASAGLSKLLDDVNKCCGQPQRRVFTTACAERRIEEGHVDSEG